MRPPPPRFPRPGEVRAAEAALDGAELSIGGSEEGFRQLQLAVGLPAAVGEDEPVRFEARIHSRNGEPFHAGIRFDLGTPPLLLELLFRLSDDCGPFRLVPENGNHRVLVSPGRPLDLVLSEFERVI